jgi:hypothetical protein
MTPCEFKTECRLFSEYLFDKPGMCDLYKSRYCEVDPARCARRGLAESSGNDYVPSDLMPNDYERAGRIRIGIAV